MAPDLAAYRAARLVLIGGAPRTGTSMLVRALDWHPRLVMFPFEPNFLERVCRGDASGLEAYARAAFLAPGSGKQAILGDPPSLARLMRSLHADYAYEDANGLGAAASARFRQAYDHALESVDGALERRMIVALLFAFATALPAVAARYPRPDFLAVKVPFYVELTALSLDEKLAKPIYLHAERAVVGRYVSAKQRFLNAKDAAQGIGPINGTDFATAQADISIASAFLADENIGHLGQRYRRISYTSLLVGGVGSLRRMLGDVGIGWDAIVARQTLLGQTQQLPSAAGFVNHHAWIDAWRRFRAGRRCTSAAERTYVRARRRLSQSPHLADKPRFCDRLRRLMRTTFPGESPESSALRKELAGQDSVASLLGQPVTARLTELAHAGRLKLL